MVAGNTRTSVIIPNYNGKEYIEGCLKSVLLSGVPVDVIVVDNGSTDGSDELVKGFPGVKLIKLEENTGFANAVNVGIGQSDTEFVYLLNNDACIKRDTIKELEKAMDDHPKAFSIQSKMLKMSDRSVIDSAGDYYCILGWAFSRGRDKSASYFEHGIKRIFSSCAGAAIYRRAYLEKTGLFDETHFAYLEDVDLGYRANLMGYRNYVDLESEVYHAGSASSGSRYNEFKTKLSSKNSIYLIYKNMPVIQVLINLPFLFAGYMIKALFFMRKGMGISYINGLLKGLDMCVSGRYSNKKVRLSVKELPRYVVIEAVLLVNCLARFI